MRRALRRRCCIASFPSLHAVFMQRAIRLNKDYKGLWLHYFKLELLHLLRLRARRQLIGISDADVRASIDPDSAQKKEEEEEVPAEKVAQRAFFRGAIPIIVYNNAIEGTRAAGVFIFLSLFSLLSSFSPLSLLFLSSFFPLSFLFLSSFFPLSLLFLSSFCPLSVLFLSSFCPLSVLFRSYFSLPTPILCRFTLIGAFFFQKPPMICNFAWRF